VAVVSNPDLRLSAGREGFVRLGNEVVVVQYSGSKLANLGKSFKNVDWDKNNVRVFPH
jgi:hypothetical protein